MPFCWESEISILPDNQAEQDQLLWATLDQWTTEIFQTAFDHRHMKPQVQRLLNSCGHLGRIWQFWQYSACTYESVTPQVSAWEKKAYLRPRKIKSNYSSMWLCSSSRRADSRSRLWDPGGRDTTTEIRETLQWLTVGPEGMKELLLAGGTEPCAGS